MITDYDQVVMSQSPITCESDPGKPYLVCPLFDLLLAADVGQVSVLCLLDLTAAFDTVDHQLLLHRLERQYGLLTHSLVWSAWCRLGLVLVVFDR